MTKIAAMKAGTRFMLKTDTQGCQEFIRTDKDGSRGWPVVVRLDTGEITELPKYWEGRITHKQGS